MASLQEDGANMSVDEGTIDIVWQSTQPPAIQTMLQESKRKYSLNSRYSTALQSLGRPLPL